MRGPEARGAVVLVIGSLHYDIMVETERLPLLDETAVGRRWYPKSGGKGGNQAVSACRHGGRARMLGAVGDDAFGVFLRGALTAAGVDDRFVRVAPDAGSGMSVALTNADGDYAAVIVSGANLTIGAAEVGVPEVWNDVGLLVLQNEIPEAANVAAAREAKARGIRVLLNAAPYREMPDALRGLVDMLVVNAVEAEMSGCGPVDSLASAGAAAQRLGRTHPSVVVTAGALGLALLEPGREPFLLPSDRVEAGGSHGAGDAFIGALAAALVAGQGMVAACRAAANAAARHVAGSDRRFTPGFARPAGPAPPSVP